MLGPRGAKKKGLGFALLGSYISYTDISLLDERFKNAWLVQELKRLEMGDIEWIWLGFLYLDLHQYIFKRL